MVARVAAVLLALALLAPVGARAGVVPSQFIAKLYTELLGRAPTPSESSYLEAIFALESITCDVARLHQLGHAVATSTEFTGLYPEAEPGGKAARIIALVRAVYGHDPNLFDWVVYHDPYAAGTKTWTQTVDAIFYNGIFELLVLDQVCDPVDPDAGFPYQEPLDVLDLIGAGPSRSQTELQAALNAASPGGTVYLGEFEVVRIGGASVGNQHLVVPAGVTLATAGAPGLGRYARMGRLVPDGLVCDLFLCSQTGIVTLEPGAALRNVWVDGQGTHENNFKLANVETLGSSVADPTVVEDCRLSEPGHDGTALRARGFGTTGVACEGQVIDGNLITAYASANAPDGMGQAQWADGIGVFCEGATVTDNELIDVSDTGIVLYGVQHRDLGPATQHSQVTGNTVFSAGNAAHVALGADAVGECLGVRAGPVVPCLDVFDTRSFVGALVADNVLWTGARTHFDVGLLVGSRPLWGDHGILAHGAAFVDNTTPNPTRVNMGVSVLGMFDTTLVGNGGQFTLLDTRPAIVNLKCPQVDVGIGGPALASVLPGAQPGVQHDDADGCVLPAPAQPAMERITVSGETFVGATSGRPYTPWGFQLPTRIEEYDDQDFPRLVGDLREMKRLGGNAVRLLLQFVELVDPPSPGFPDGTPNTDSLDWLADTLVAAEETGLYLVLTGLGIEDDALQPAWYDNRDEAGRWAAQRVFWGAVAGVAKDSPAVLAYDLMNEPVVNSPTGWCAGSFGGLCFAQALTLTPGGRTNVEIAQAWIQEMRQAIDGAGDAGRPVTVGMLPGGLTQFSHASVAGDLDFLCTHIYPSTGGVQPAINLAEHDKVAGQPLLVEETYIIPDLTVPPAVWLPTLDDVAADEEAFILGTRTTAAGWLGTYFGTTPLEQAMVPPPSCLIPAAVPNLACVDPLNEAWVSLFVRNHLFVHPAGDGHLATLSVRRAGCARPSRLGPAWRAARRPHGTWRGDVDGGGRSDKWGKSTERPVSEVRVPRGRATATESDGIVRLAPRRRRTPDRGPRPDRTSSPPGPRPATQSGCDLWRTIDRAPGAGFRYQAIAWGGRRRRSPCHVSPGSLGPGNGGSVLGRTTHRPSRRRSDGVAP